MTHRGKIVLLPPNRVWRTYPGGRTLDRIAGAPAPADAHFPEDWIASTTRAVNPGREHLAEGPSPAIVGGRSEDFSSLLARDPAYFLGAAHARRFGATPRLLVKLLDPATRLHFQVHPTTAFARRFLSAPSGKTEAYHVLATRPEVAEPCIYLGFQRPPARAALRRMILEQDIPAIEACFDPIPVAPGDTYLVPGGVPHALGAGVFLVEIQEPSDLVVRFEFERAGYVLPESARFMGRDPDFCLDVFDFSAWPAARVALEGACRPIRRRALGPDSWQDDLIGPTRTPCFRVRLSHLHGAVTKTEDSCYVAVVTDGACVVEAGGERHRVERYNRFFCPAGLGPVTICPEPHARLLECYPPAD
ncbi:MAG TPA: class I mannose-6-phosphate isomerase [Opitutaceae bacterium]|nr:class I mannose-6-phosphate isomerase [Opitutaceae bacterium]